MQLEITHATDKGARRYQEDRYVVHRLPHGHLLAVFDGHGGDECAEYCARELTSLTDSIINSIASSGFRGIFGSLNEQTKNFSSGCAASIVYVDEKYDKVTVGVLGDVPVIVHPSYANGTVWVAPEHNVRSNKSEAKAAEGRGGIVVNGYLFNRYSGNGLQMSRALGDSSLDGVLSREPEIFNFSVGPGGYVLVASDGILDPGHNSDFMLDIQDTDTAESLVEAAVKVPTGDNVTAVLVRFK